MAKRLSLAENDISMSSECSKNANGMDEKLFKMQKVWP